MDSHTEETLKQALNEYENMRDKTERTYYQNCLVAMGDEVQRLRAKLNTIAFPRRGSPEAGWGIYDIARFAAERLGGEREEAKISQAWLSQQERPVEESAKPEVDTDSFVEDALRDLVPADFHPDKRLLTRLKLLVDAWREANESLQSAKDIYQSIAKEVPPRFFGISLASRVKAMTLELGKESRVLVAPAAQREAFVAGYAANSELALTKFARRLAEEEAHRRYPDAAGEGSRDEEESSKRADDLANAFVGGTNFMATHPDCTTDQVFAEANRRYSARL